MKRHTIVLLVLFSVVLLSNTCFALSEKATEMLDALKKKCENTEKVASEPDNNIVVPANDAVQMQPECPFGSASRQEVVDEVFNRAMGGGGKIRYSREYIFKNDPSLLSARMETGESLLHIAVKYGNEDWVWFLLDRKIEVNTKDNWGCRALDYCKKSKIENILIGHGAKRARKPNKFITTYTEESGDTLTSSPKSSSVRTYIGPRGGVYHYSASGKKVYEKRR